MGPKGDFRYGMYQPEVARFGLPTLIIITVDQHQIEQRLVVPLLIILCHCGKLLVGWHQWGRDIMSEKNGARSNMQEAN